MWQSPTYVPGVSKCQACRRAAWAHGDLVRYDKGKCRCDLCKAAKRDAMREYTARRKAAGNPLDYEKYRKRRPAVCPTCRRSFEARADVRFCSKACNPRIQLTQTRSARLRRMTPEGRAFRLRAEKVAETASAGTSGGGLVWVQGPCQWCGEEFMSRGERSRYCSREHRAQYRMRSAWIDWRVRLSIYERDGWTCQLCGDAALLGMKGTSAPTLDHIVPRSKGGSHDPSNLRLLCMWCNSKRGDLTYFTDEEVRSAFFA